MYCIIISVDVGFLIEVIDLHHFDGDDRPRGLRQREIRKRQKSSEGLSMSWPWVMFGDFNIVRTAEEKKGWHGICK